MFSFAQIFKSAVVPADFVPAAKLLAVKAKTQPWACELSFENKMLFHVKKHGSYILADKERSVSRNGN